MCLHFKSINDNDKHDKHKCIQLELVNIKVNYTVHDQIGSRGNYQLPMITLDNLEHDIPKASPS